MENKRNPDQGRDMLKDAVLALLPDSKYVCCILTVTNMNLKQLAAACN